MNKKTISKIIEVIKTLQEIIPEEAISKVLSIISNGIPTKPERIPIPSCDSDIEAFIVEYELDKPENMFRFFVELYFESFEVLHDAINDLKEIDLINTISIVKGAKKTYDMSKGMTDEQRKLQSIVSAQAALNEASSQLEGKIMFYIDKQRKIDSMSRFKKALKGKLLVKEIINNNNMAKQAISILIADVYLQTVIAHDTGDDINSSIIEPYTKFKDRILSNNNCILMKDYDKNYKDKFWANLEEALSSVSMASKLTIEMNNCSDEEL